jgi:acyl-CoA thioester hydrolase
MNKKYTTKIEVRYRDLDPNEHVNHAVYASYLEHARTKYYEDVLDKKSTDLDHVIVSVSIDYHASVGLGDILSVEIYVDKIGRSSVERRYDVRCNGDIVATGKTTHVFIDRNTNKPKPVPEEHRSKLEAFHSE